MTEKNWPQEVHGLFLEKRNNDLIAVRPGWWLAENGSKIHLDTQIDIDVKECDPNRWYSVFLVPRDGVTDPLFLQVVVEGANTPCGTTSKFKNARRVGIFYKDQNGVR